MIVPLFSEWYLQYCHDSVDKVLLVAMHVSLDVAIAEDCIFNFGISFQSTCHLGI